MPEIDATSEVEAPGEVPASTGGVVDLDRILGTIPVVLVFMEDLTAPAEREVLRSLGDRLADFGHERTQVLGVAPVGSDEVADLVAGVGGNARVLADADRSLAARFGGSYRPGRVTTVVVGAGGEVAATWVNEPGGTFAEELLARISQLAAR